MSLVSMTGFGRAGCRISDRLLAAVVIRSVNHRYLDVQVRTNLREEVPEIDALVRSVTADFFRRGRVNAQVDIEWQHPPEARVTVNAAAVRDVVLQLREITTPEGEFLGTVSAADVLAVPGLVTISNAITVLDDGEQDGLRDLLAAASERALEMRRDEGARIGEQIAAELARVEAFVEWFEPQMEGLRDQLFARARERIEKLLGEEATIDEERMVQESALLADRADVAEEIVRLRAHLENFAQRMKAGGVVGRALDFLCQEIHRELNTLGSKCREVEVSGRVVDAKTAAERVREQVQNLE